jgi:uncharacterized membrane protein
MDWRIWLAFGVGLFIGVNLIILLIGLLVVAREARESHRIQDKPTNHTHTLNQHVSGKVWSRVGREYVYLN